MADMFSPEKRSEIMSHIRSKGTVAEQLVFKYLRSEHIYFQKHYSKAPGNPDIALPRKKKAVFIDSEFWHGKDYGRIIKNRPEGDYWVKKIKYNMDRDKKVRAELISKGWQLLIVWEKDIKRKRTQQEALNSIKNFLKP